MPELLEWLYVNKSWKDGGYIAKEATETVHKTNVPPQLNFGEADRPVTP